MATSAARAILKREVLGLYAQCLRSARRCPAWEQREMMRAYVKMKFRHDVDVQDPARIRSLLADAREELERMDYYHSVYQAKLREQEAKWQASTMTFVASAMPAPEIQIAICPHCSTAFQPPTARFCSNCGEKRANAATS